jgi:hypothetical protein
MPDRKFIPLENADDVEGPVTFTDVVIALHVEGLPTQLSEDDEAVFEAGALAESVVAAFALGCAVGVEFPDRVGPILEQTHEDAVEHIIEECRGPLTELVSAAKEAAEPLQPESFIESLVDGVEQSEYADNETAHNALSMSFEYGCILAHVQRSAAILVRNAYNREQDAAVRELQAEDPDDADDDDLPGGPDPFHSVQEFATEVMEAYEADIGFASA